MLTGITRQSVMFGIKVSGQAKLTEEHYKTEIIQSTTTVYTCDIIMMINQFVELNCVKVGCVKSCLFSIQKGCLVSHTMISYWCENRLCRSVTNNGAHLNTGKDKLHGLESTSQSFINQLSKRNDHHAVVSASPSVYMMTEHGAWWDNKIRHSLLKGFSSKYTVKPQGEINVSRE